MAGTDPFARRRVPQMHGIIPRRREYAVLVLGEYRAADWSIVQHTLLSDHDVTQIARGYGVTIADPICPPRQAPANIDWARIARLDGSCGGFAQQVLELGEDLLDRVQIGRIFRQKEELCANRADECSHDFTFVTAEIVHDDDVPGLQGREQNFLDVKLTSSISSQSGVLSCRMPYLAT